jgi:hypothetical protein
MVRIVKPRLKKHYEKYFFQVASILILFFSIIGFSDNLFTDAGQSISYWQAKNTLLKSR